VTADIERLWITARNTHGQFGDRRRPSPGIAAVLGALWCDGSSYGGEIAQRTKQDQGNTARWLVKLRLYGLVDVVEEVPGIGNQGGGRPAIFWQLTGAGRELAELLAAEVEMAA